MATCATEPEPECVGASREATDLLKLLELADLEDWHSKFLCYGYETVEDVELMNEENMKEIGLESWQRFRLKLNLPKKAASKCTKQTPEIASSARGPPKRDNAQEVPKSTPVIPSAPQTKTDVHLPSGVLRLPKCDNTQEVPKEADEIFRAFFGPPKRDHTYEVREHTPVVPSAPTLAPPKCDNTQEVPRQTPVIPSAVLQPEKCRENGCRQMAVSKCRECQKLLCLTHQQTIRKEETSGNSTIVFEVPGCSKCKEEHEKRNECEGLAKCLGGLLIPLVIGLIFLGVSSAHNS